MTLAPAGTWAGQIADLISLADLVMLQAAIVVKNGRTWNYSKRISDSAPGFDRLHLSCGLGAGFDSAGRGLNRPGRIVQP